jgi:hypothetical protein
LTISPYVFGYIGCAITANSESYDLSPVKTAFQSKVAGRFRASFNVIENPRLKLKWKGYLPSELLYPTFEDYWEDLAALAMLSSVALTSITVIYFWLKFLGNHQRTHLFSFAGQVLWLISVLLQSNYIYVKMDIDWQAFVWFFYMITRNAATIYSVGNTAANLIAITGPTEYEKQMAYGALTSIHVFLALACYYASSAYFGSDDEFYQSWLNLNGLWVFYLLFVFCFMVTPPGYLIYKVVIKDSAKGPLNAFINLLENDHTFAALLLAYFGSVSVWAILKAISCYGKISLGSDRVFWAIEAVLELFAALPFMINCLFLEHVPIMFQSIPNLVDRISKNDASPHRAKYSERTPIIGNSISYGNYQQSSKKVASFPPPPLSWDEEQDFAIGEDSDHK